MTGSGGEIGPLLVATGIEREARLVRAPGVLAFAGAGDAPALAFALAAHAPRARGVVSFGFCGALDPALRVGDWIVGERLTGETTAETSRVWSDALAAGLPRVLRGAVHSDGRLVLRRADKAGLFRRTGAVAVDMESHVAAAVARTHDLPLAIVRLVSDEAGHDLPEAFARAMRPDGGIALGTLLSGTGWRPRAWAALARTLLRLAGADRRLRRDARSLAPVLARLGSPARLPSAAAPH